MDYSPLARKKREKEFFKQMGELASTQRIQLLVEVAEKKDERQVWGEIAQFAVDDAHIHAYEYIPYVAITAPREKAVLLAQALYRQGYRDDRLQHLSTKTLLDVEISHTMTIPELSLPGQAPLSTMYRQRYRDYRRGQGALGEQEDKEIQKPRWNLRNIGFYNLSNMSSPGRDINLAIIDTGCDYNHLEIRSRFNRSRLGYNIIEKNNDPKDGHSHGTHCAGSAAGVHVGVARGCNLFAVKVLDDRGSGSEAGVIEGIEWCIKNGMHVGSMSLGSPTTSRAFKMICDRSRLEGLVLVAAAGNSYFGDSYPAAFDSVIAVAAVDRKNMHAEFSNVSTHNNISAPGVDVFSCIPNGEYAKYSGTSMATPHVAGVLTARLEVKHEDPEDLEDRMERKAQPLGTGTREIDRPVYGAGLVRVDKLVGDTEV